MATQGLIMVQKATDGSDAGSEDLIFSLEFVNLKEGDVDGFYSHCRGADPVLAISKNLLQDIETFNQVFRLLMAIHKAIPQEDFARIFDFQIFVKDSQVIGPWKERLEAAPLFLTSLSPMAFMLKSTKVIFERVNREESFRIYSLPPNRDNPDLRII
jgi:hypothetical protein